MAAKMPGKSLNYIDDFDSSGVIYFAKTFYFDLDFILLLLSLFVKGDIFNSF